jgi:hypothetical protein
VSNTTVDAKKSRFDSSDALKLVAGADELIVSKGRKVIQVNLRKDKPTKEDLLGLLLGPTGNLRAPTFKVGKTVVVGFEEDMYTKVLVRNEP